MLIQSSFISTAPAWRGLVEGAINTGEKQAIFMASSTHQS